MLWSNKRIRSLNRARKLIEQLSELSRLDAFRREFKRKFKGSTSRKIREFIRDFGALRKDDFIEKAKEHFADLKERGLVGDSVDDIMKAIEDIA